MGVNRHCPLCGEKFKGGDIVVRVEQVSHVGNVHTEITEKGQVAHRDCRAREGAFI